MLGRGFQRLSQSLAGDCSLCGKYSTRLKTHLSRHLEQLSLFAIRQTDFMVDVGAEEMGSGVAHRTSNLTTNSAVPRQHTDSSEQASASADSNFMVLEPQLVHTRSSVVSEEAMPEIPLIIESRGDTSWDNITSKFQEAREAMYGHKLVDPASSHSETNSSDFKDVQAMDSRSYHTPTCGASVGALRYGKNLPPCSMGGIILIDDEPYGMTVVHLIEVLNGNEDDTHIDSHEDGKTTQESSSLDHRWLLKFGFDYKINPADSGNSLGLEQGIIVTQPAYDDWIEAKTSSASQNHDDLLSHYTLGRIHTSSKSWNFDGNIENKMDWALIKMDPDRIPKFNVIQGGKIFCKKRVIHPELPLAHTYAHEYDNDENEYPTELAESHSLPGRNVHWYGRTSGLQLGVIQDDERKVRGAYLNFVFYDLKKIVQGNCGTSPAIYSLPKWFHHPLHHLMLPSAGRGRGSMGD
jgi:hypothetical protein